MAVVSESGDLLDLASSSCKSSEDSTDVGSLLHRDDSELVLLIDPDKESLFVVVEDTSAIRPVAV